MKILNYQYTDKFWNYQKVEFQDVNLLVGDSGAGKTRLLNTIFNAGSMVAQRKARGADSNWSMTISIGDDKYYWAISNILEADKVIVQHEELSRDSGESIFVREKSSLSFEGKSSFVVPADETGISILREEEIIKPLFTGFSRILRRNFFGDAVGSNSALQTMNSNVLAKLGKSKDLNKIFDADLGINLRLFLLKTYFNDIYKKIVETYLASFEFLKEASIINSDKLEDLEVPISSTPVFCVKERSVNKWIRLDELSSGMQKALLIITDLLSMPNGVIYLIDEYENSLGIGPINILPDILLFEDIKKQVIVTSHHPYIIPKFPVENWLIAHRKGSNVRFAYGKELVDRYEVSRQDKYLQLINDPLYSEGIE